ncbi:MAG: hypothetical protein ACT4OJ_02545 [Bacteroidota bacterium]
MMKPKGLTLLFMLCIIFSSCRTPRFVYAPAPPNSPYLREKGESKLAGYYSTGGDDNNLTSEYNNGLDLQAALAVSGHWAVTADYFMRREKDAVNNFDRTYFDSSVVAYRRHLTSFGAGYFVPVTKDRNIMFSVYGGAGFGKLSFDDNGINNGNINYSRYYGSNLAKWYIQPAISFFAGRYFRTGLIGKFSWVHYGKASSSYTAGELSYLGLDRLPGSTLVFVETTWNMQVSAPKMEWLCLEGGFTLSSEPFDNNTNLEARNFNASIGLSLNIGKMKRK